MLQTSLFGYIVGVHDLHLGSPVIEDFMHSNTYYYTPSITTQKEKGKFKTSSSQSPVKFCTSPFITSKNYLENQSVGDFLFGASIDL